jgi:hypothetical protein
MEGFFSGLLGVDDISLETSRLVFEDEEKVDGLGRTAS